MNGKKSKVDELRERLYSRTKYSDPKHHHRDIDRVEGPEVKEGWDTTGLKDLLSSEREMPDAHPLIRKIFRFSVFFFILAIVIAGFVFFGGSNFVSSKNVDITILGPTSISAGDPLELGVTIENKNNADLDVVDFAIEYPQGARDVNDSSKSLNYDKESLGSLRAGDSFTRNIEMLLFGPQGDTQTVKFSVEYKVKDSNATFYKDKIYEISIGDTPITFSIDSPTAVTSGEEFTANLHVTLNSTEVLRGVMIRGEYPYGFTMYDSSPEVVSDGNIWSLGDLAPGEKKSVRIRGKLLGEDGEDRTFRFYVGVRDAGSSSPNFKTNLISNQRTISISRPSLGMNVTINGSSSNSHVVALGRSINTTVRYQNNLTEKLLNPKIEARLSGSSLDKASVRVQNGGFYDSQNNRVLWNLVSSQGVAELASGQGGQVGLSFASLSSIGAGSQNRELSLSITISGTVVGKPVSVTENYTIRIASEVSLYSKALYSQGAFTNTGPIPPRAEAETTYTAVLGVRNTQSDMENARVTARLASGVTWIGAHSISSEDVSYDASSNSITWQLGSLPSDEAVLREVSFQVALTPSISQVGTTPVLVNNIAFSGVDVFTQKVISATNAPLTTRLSSDPKFIQGDDIVKE